MLSRSRRLPIRARAGARSLGLAAAIVAAPFAAAPWASALAQFQVPGRDAFSREPRTPLEAWEVADYLIKIGEPEQAAPYIKKFLAANPDDATLLKVRDEFGAGSILRLSDSPATRPYAAGLARRLSEASVRNSTDPARIARFVAALSKTREEQAYAIERLREAGSFAVPPIVAELNRAGLEPSARAPLADSLGKLDRTAVPALIATLDSPDAVLVGDSARALGRIGDPRALPALTYLAAKVPGPVAGPAAAEAIRALTGRPFGSQPKTPVRVLSDEARRYHLHAVRFPGDPVVLWNWDPATNAPAPGSYPARDAEGLLGLRAARESLSLDPSDVEAQVNLVSLALDHDPDNARPQALASGADILGRVVRTAIADGRGPLAVSALGLLARVVDRNDLATEGRPNPLVEALSGADRRVQFAAAEALVKLDPRGIFPGSSRVVSVLARFAAGQAEPRAIVIDGNAQRGGQTAGLLRDLGYQSEVLTRAAQGFEQAAASADVELIVADPYFVDDTWGLPELLGNLRADGRTAGIPIFLVGPLALRDRMASSVESYPATRFLITPTETFTLRDQITRAMTSLGVRPLSGTERADFARRAAGLLALVGRRPGSPFESDLPTAEPALSIALNSEAAPIDAASALGDVPGPAAQRALGDVTLDGSKGPALRLAAAGNLARHIRRFGPKLAADQERRLVAELNGEADPTLRDALAAVVGALKPGPDASGSRLQTYRSSSP